MTDQKSKNKLIDQAEYKDGLVGVENILDIPLVGSDALPMIEYYQDQIATYGLSSY